MIDCRTIKEWKKGTELPKPVSEFRESLSTMLTFFVSDFVCWRGCEADK